MITLLFLVAFALLAKDKCDVIVWSLGAVYALATGHHRI